MKNPRSIGCVCVSQGKSVEAIEKLEVALGIYRTIHGNDHESVAMALGNLGHVYLQTNRLDVVISSPLLVLI
jgi:hypothetical protein